MIFANINQNLPYLPENVKECLEFAKKNDLLSFEPGSHEIDGKRLFVNIAEYETTERENRPWEAHKDYLDLHLMLRGSEILDLGFIENMEQKEYVPEEDFLPLDGDRSCSVILSEGDFLVCYPDDAHLTAVKNGEIQKIKKAIFKIQIK